MKQRALKILKWVYAFSISGLLLFAIPFFGFGVNGIIKQHYKITTYKPIEATIVSSSIAHSKLSVFEGPTYHTYKPNIKYTYIVGGNSYLSEKVAIFETHSGRKWANSIVRKFRVGSKATAFYNPNNPSDSFLYNKYIFLEAYGIVLWSVPLFMVAFLLWRYNWRFSLFRSIEPRVIEDSEWYELIPVIRNIDKFNMATVSLSIGLVIAIPTFGHYFWVAKSPYDPDAIYHLYVFFLLSPIPVVFVLSYFLTYYFVGEATIRINKNKFLLGDKITFRYQQKIKRKSIAEKTQFAIFCEKQTLMRHKYWKVLEDSRHVESEIIHQVNFQIGEIVTFNDIQIDIQHQFCIPFDKPISSDPDDGICYDIPRYYWFFQINIHIFWKLMYKVQFPIKVQTSSIREEDLEIERS